MGFMDELKKLARPYAEDEDDFDDDFDLEERPRASRASTAPRASSFDDSMEDVSPRPAFGRRSSDSKVVNIATTAQMQVVLVKPDRYDDVTTIADHLNDRKTVVLNLEAADKELARRIVDFLSGATYANHGNMRKVSRGTFLIVPNGVDMMGEVMLEDFEESNMYF